MDVNTLILEQNTCAVRIFFNDNNDGCKAYMRLNI